MKELYTTIDLADVMSAMPELDEKDAKMIAQTFAEQKRPVNANSVRRMAKEISPRYDDFVETTAKTITKSNKGKALSNLVKGAKGLGKGLVRGLPALAAAPTDMDGDPSFDDPSSVEYMDRMNKLRLADALQKRQAGRAPARDFNRKKALSNVVSDLSPETQEYINQVKIDLERQKEIDAKRAKLDERIERIKNLDISDQVKHMVLQSLLQERDKSAE